MKHRGEDPGAPGAAADQKETTRYRQTEKLKGRFLRTRKGLNQMQELTPAIYIHWRFSVFSQKP